MGVSKMSLNASEWERIGASSVVVDWIKNGVRMPFLSEPEPRFVPNPQFSDAQRTFLDAEISDLVDKGVISKVENRPFCVSALKVVPKKLGKYRLICDLRYVNSHCNVSHFSCENVSVLPEIMRNNERVVTIDLKDGFYHFPVHPDCRKYLGFAYGGCWYVWNRLPFSWANSPYCFNKCIRAVVEYFRREHSMSIMAYVDDFLLAAPKAQILNHLSIFTDTLDALGLQINLQKSSLEPAVQATYLGFDVHCANADRPPAITVPKAKVAKLKQDISRALKRSHIAARLLARIAGRCISMLAAVFPCKLKLRNVYRLINSRRSWEDLLPWTDEAADDLRWWIRSLDGWNGRVLLPPAAFDMQLSTDASASGWGAMLSEPACQTASGFWTLPVSQESSNFRELLAIYLALRSLSQYLASKNIEILSDNVTAVALINKFGSSDVRLDAIAQSIWSFAFQNRMMLTAHHISGESNSGPDALSRLPLRHEWYLHPEVFRQLDRMFGPHSIDRFATCATAHLPLYNSRYLDPGTAGVDALGQSDWVSHNNFVNPPFRLVSRVLDIVEAQQAVATLIAPFWPAQPWMARLRQMSIAPPLRLPPVAQTCVPMLPGYEVIEPHRNPAWKLYAWRICGVPR